MNLIIVGPQGCGKGTQAEKIMATYDMDSFSTGDALRAEAKSGSALGQEVKKLIDAGILVPDNIINDILENAINKASKGLIFDGYPRTLDQAQHLLEKTTINAIVNITISDDEAVKRISSRWRCPVCKRRYNTISLPPKTAGVCDDDGTALTQRADAKPDAVRKRLKAYHEQTEPILAYFEEQGIPVHHIDGEQPIEQVFADIQAHLE